MSVFQDKIIPPSTEKSVPQAAPAGSDLNKLSRPPVSAVAKAALADISKLSGDGPKTPHPGNRSTPVAPQHVEPIMPGRMFMVPQNSAREGILNDRLKPVKEKQAGDPNGGSSHE